MSLTKVTYNDGATVIHAQNLNDIQDEIITNAANIEIKVNKIDGSNLVADSKIASYDSHLLNTSNPHSVTKSQVGLGNVDNTSDANKPVSTAMQSALDAKLPYVTTNSDCKLVYQGVALHVNNAYYWKICFPHNTSSASGIYFVMSVIAGGYGSGCSNITISGYDYTGSSTWISGGISGNTIGWKVYLGNDGEHPCVLIGSGAGSYWQSCCVPWVYYHNAANNGKLTISAVESTDNISRLLKVA